MITDQKYTLDFGGCLVRIHSPRAWNMLKYVGGVWVCGGMRNMCELCDNGKSSKGIFLRVD